MPEGGLSSEELAYDTSHTTLFSLLYLVNTVRSHTSAKRQQVHSVAVVRPVHSLGNVVNDTRLETDPRVGKQKCRHGGVKNHRRTAEERSTDQRNKANSHGSLTGPVGRSVQLGWFGRLVSIIDGSHNVTGRLGNSLDVAGSLHNSTGSSGELFMGLEAKTGQHGEGVGVEVWFFRYFTEEAPRVFCLTSLRVDWWPETRTPQTSKPFSGGFFASEGSEAAYSCCGSSKESNGTGKWGFWVVYGCFAGVCSTRYSPGFAFAAILRQRWRVVFVESWFENWSLKLVSQVENIEDFGKKTCKNAARACSSMPFHSYRSSLNALLKWMDLRKIPRFRIDFVFLNSWCGKFSVVAL